MSLVEQLVAIVGGIVTIVAGGITAATALARMVRRRRARADSAARSAATTSEVPPPRGVRQDRSGTTPARPRVAAGESLEGLELQQDEVTATPDQADRAGLPLATRYSSP
jgi:hypothetical protein